MKLQEALKIMKEDKRKIFTVREAVSEFKDEIFFVTHTNMYDEPLRDDEKYTNGMVKLPINISNVTESYDYREITEDEFNYLWELDYDERFPELKESFEYYDQVVYKQTEGAING